MRAASIVLALASPMAIAALDNDVFDHPLTHAHLVRRKYDAYAASGPGFAGPQAKAADQKIKWDAGPAKGGQSVSEQKAMIARRGFSPFMFKGASNRAEEQTATLEKSSETKSMESKASGGTCKASCAAEKAARDAKNKSYFAIWKGIKWPMPKPRSVKLTFNGRSTPSKKQSQMLTLENSQRLEEECQKTCKLKGNAAIA